MDLRDVILCGLNWNDLTQDQARIYARATGARAQGGKFPGAAY
jgi:hypothetical protein